MPWSSQNGGGGGWKSGGGGPWGQGPGGQQPSPDLEEILKKSQDRLKQAMPGGRSSGPFMFLFFLLALAVIGYLAFTVTVKPDEQGVVLRFGKYDRTLLPGLNFRLPYPLEEVFLPKVTRVNTIVIGAQGSRDVRAESLMLTGDENIVDVDFTVLWQVKDAKDFLFNIQNPMTTVRAIAESAMREIVGKGEIQPILTQERDKTQQAVQTLIQQTLDDYKAGIVINEVQMQQVDPPKEVIDAFRDVQAAKADQERVQNEAEAYANRVVPEARGEAERILQGAKGYKDQTIAEATGEANRFLKVYNEYKKAPEVTRKRMFLETMERVFGGTDKIIIDPAKGGQGVVPYLPLDQLRKDNSSRAGGQ